MICEIILFAVDLSWSLEILLMALAMALGMLHMARNMAPSPRYSVVDSNFLSREANFFDRTETENMPVATCAHCGCPATVRCSRCKMVKYCSKKCQIRHWKLKHRAECEKLQLVYKANHTKPTSTVRRREATLLHVGGSSKIHKQSNKILFPYEEFVRFFDWDKPGYPPCGLLNFGNSCFANVVLQCLAYTRPLVAYLLEKGHRVECQRDNWCFLCEFQLHVERASRSLRPFSPYILSRLPNIGGNLGHGKQEEAHEFMRFAIETMQSVCLAEFGGEKAVHPSYQVTTLIQHIFGGCLRSQFRCEGCNNVSVQFENIMDITVEVHRDAESLADCLRAKMWPRGNTWRSNCCKPYVMGYKTTTIQRAPNILIFALKSCQRGRFGKLNTNVTFPETLDLSPYMSELEVRNNVYKLYAVIVHVEKLNASTFGNYISYVKDFSGNWYKIADSEVASVDLDEVLSQGAHMLLYSRIYARPSCLLSDELLRKEESENARIHVIDSSMNQPTKSLSDAACVHGPVNTGHSSSSSANGAGFKVNCREESSFSTDAEDARGNIKTVFTTPNEVASPITHACESHLTPYRGGRITKNPTEVSKKYSITKLVECLNGDIGELRKANKGQMEGLFGRQAMLRNREEELRKGLKEMQGEKKALEQQVQMLLMETNALERWLRDNEVNNGDVDEALDPRDALSKQMLDCNASDLAVEDAIYALDEALQEGAIPFDQYLRNVRLLSRKMFYYRAMASKVSAVLMTGSAC